MVDYSGAIEQNFRNEKGMTMHRPKTLIPLFFAALALPLLTRFTSAASSAADPRIPHLRKNGVATHLMVDGRPWLIRGGELANTASSDLNYLKPVWPRLARLNFNTVLVAVAWA